MNFIKKYKIFKYSGFVITTTIINILQNKMFCDIDATKLYLLKPLNSYELSNLLVDKNPTQEMCYRAIKSNIKLGNFNIQSNTVCLAYIEHDYNNLKYVREQTKELCRFAIEKNANAIQYSNNQTYELCKFAIEKDVRIFQYIKPSCNINKCCADENEMLLYINEIYELCKIAIQKDSFSLQYVVRIFNQTVKSILLNCENQTQDKFNIIIDNKIYELCKLAVQWDGNALQHIENQTDKICELAVQQNGDALQYVKNQTYLICKLAVQQNGNSIKHAHIHILSDKHSITDLYVLAIEKNYQAIQYIKNPSDEICKLAIKKNYHTLKYIKNPTDEICKLAIEKNYLALKYIKNPTDEMRELAMKKLNEILQNNNKIIDNTATTNGIIVGNNQNIDETNVQTDEQKKCYLCLYLGFLNLFERP